MAKKSSTSGGRGCRKYHRRKDKPAQQRYINEDRSTTNKIKKAQRLANKFNKPVKIKIDGKMEEIKPN